MRNWGYKNAENMVGVRNGKLTVVGVCATSVGIGKHVMLLCKCDCGRTISVRATLIKKQKQTSCGCENIIRLKKQNKKHGYYGTRLYNIWTGMLGRTKYKVQKEKNNYWGRGISVCKEWENFVNFKEWAFKNGYKDLLTLDRIDVNGDYCPENCRWATPKEQANNRRNNRFIVWNNENKTMKEWAEYLGIKYGTFIKRIRTHGICEYVFYPGKYNTNGAKK